MGLLGCKLDSTFSIVSIPIVHFGRICKMNIKDGFILANIHSYGDPVTCSDYAYTCSRNYNTEEQLNDVIALQSEHEDELNGATQSFDQAVENINNNINWMSNYFASIKQWLNDHSSLVSSFKRPSKTQ